MGRTIGKCPACEHTQYEIAKLRCRNCGTTVEGSFGASRLGSLPAEHQEFIEVFIRCRGNIKDVERELGISYPTVRGRLDRAIRALGHVGRDSSARRAEVLDALERGDMPAEQAIRALQTLQEGE
jgi:hypothetical protein